LVDEVRVSSVARSAAWMSTAYNNQDDPASFYTVGSQETQPDPDVSVPNQSFEIVKPSLFVVIQNMTITNMAPGSQTTLVFNWNTTDNPVNRYLISAMAEAVKGEMDTEDNTYLSGPVEVKTNPDIDGDGDVDIFDVVAITGIYGCKEGMPCWNPRADLREDGVINIYDVVLVAGSYGEHLNP